MSPAPRLSRSSMKRFALMNFSPGRRLLPVALLIFLGVGCEEKPPLVIGGGPGGNNPAVTNNLGTKRVRAGGGLRLRAEPGTGSLTLAVLPDGTEVEIMKRVGTPVTIAGKKNYWYQVSYQGAEGYLFGGFLE